MTASPAALAPVTFAGVSQAYADGALVLDDVSLTVAPGEFVTIVGPSGCGKSTLLRLAAGLTRPTAGWVEVPDSTPSVVFQDANLLPWRSVLGNVELIGELDGLRRAERRARAREVLEVVGLAGFADHLPRQLSGGMRMRVSIARALVSRPDVVLFDEPFGALDEITRLSLQNELQRIVAERDVAALFITHSVSEAVYLGTRVAVMSPRPGRIVAEVAVDEPAPRDPAFRFTQGFAELGAEVSRQLAGARG